MNTLEGYLYDDDTLEGRVLFKLEGVDGGDYGVRTIGLNTYVFVYCAQSENPHGAIYDMQGNKLAGLDYLTEASRRYLSTSRVQG